MFKDAMNWLECELMFRDASYKDRRAIIDDAVARISLASCAVESITTRAAVLYQIGSVTVAAAGLTGKVSPEALVVAEARSVLQSPDFVMMNDPLYKVALQFIARCLTDSNHNLVRLAGLGTAIVATHWADFETNLTHRPGTAHEDRQTVSLLNRQSVLPAAKQNWLKRELASPD